MGIFSIRAVRADDGSARPRDPSDDAWFEEMPRKTASGAHVTIERARKLPVVRDCLQVLSQSTGSLSRGVFGRAEDGTRHPVRDHPFARLMRRPNERETATQFITNQVDDLATAGRFLARRKFNMAGDTVALTRIPPAFWEAQLLVDESLRFKVTLPGRGEEFLLQDEVWHIALPPFVDEIHGRSPILHDGVEAIGAGLAIMDYANRFFDNDATPRILFKHKGNFKDQASKENFLNAWARAFSGRRRHRPGVLEYDMDIKELSHTNEAAQFLETRKETWIDISRIWRMPPHKVGILDNATFSNIEHQGIEFVTDTLAPWLTLIEDSANTWHLDGGDEFYFEFNVASLLRGDIVTRYQAYATGRQWGWLSVNEIRKLENQNGIGPAGDRYVEPLNMVEAGSERTPDNQQGGA